MCHIGDGGLLLRLLGAKLLLLTQLVPHRLLQSRMTLLPLRGCDEAVEEQLKHLEEGL